jgi:hypothetical protein
MHSEPSTTPADGASDRRRLWALAGCGVCLGVSTVCFNLLYLFVPAGVTPIHGFTPGIGAAYSRLIALPNVVLTTKQLARASIGLQLGMWSAFIAAVYLVRKLSGGPMAKAAFKLVAASGAVIGVALVLTPPTLSGDLYQYALFGRMVITRGLNPYVATGNALAADPLFPLATWHHLSTHYGPVLTGLFVATAWVGGDNPVATALAFKALAAAGCALTAWAAAALARQQRRDGLLPLLAVAWSPLALIETAGSGHVELVMTGLAMLGLFYWRRRQRTLGFIVLMLSIHVKWVTAALAGLVVIAHVRDIAGVRARALALAKLAAIAAVVTAGLYAPFWTGWTSIRATWWLLVGSRSDVGKAGAVSLVHVALFAAVAVVAGTVVARRGQAVVLEMAAMVCLGFATFIFPWVFPWYVLPAAALLAVGPVNRLNGSLTIIVTAASMFLMAFWAVMVPG